MTMHGVAARFQAHDRGRGAMQHGAGLLAPMDAAENLLRPRQDCPVRAAREMLRLGCAGVHSGFWRHAEKATAKYGPDTRAIPIEAGRRRMAGGQLDTTLDDAPDMAAARAGGVQ